MDRDRRLYPVDRTGNRAGVAVKRRGPRPYAELVPIVQEGSGLQRPGYGHTPRHWRDWLVYSRGELRGRIWALPDGTTWLARTLPRSGPDRAMPSRRIARDWVIDR